MTAYVYKRKDGGTIDCYGKLEEDSCLSVACSFEESHKDRDITFIDTIKFNNWQKVCELLEKNLSSKIEQITAN